jgi:hypothetical protein
MDSEVVIVLGEFLDVVVFVTLGGIVGEDDFFGTCLGWNQWLYGVVRCEQHTRQ